MRTKHIFLLGLSFISLNIYAQKWTKPKTSKNTNTIARPKLVVGIVIDQMRWDYLYRFYNRYSNGGFKRLINSGFSAENTLIPYTPTYTAVGHTCIYTGSVPAVTGIIGNDWYDPQLKRGVYCTEDKSVNSVGTTNNSGKMSPKNLLVTTVTDELRLATNFRSKVIGISLKDRGAILPAGHSANAAYWYDGATGNFITSTHYMQQLPNWVSNFNAQKLANKYYKNEWNTLYPINTYAESTADVKPYEGTFKNEPNAAFPHKLSKYINNNFDVIRSTPFGNTLTFDLSKEAIAQEKLGQTGNTDFLAVSCSSTDYVGHQFGPNAIEVEDTYLRLDRDLEDFFSYLDKTLGNGNYLIFLSADHAVAHTQGFMAENKLPAGASNGSGIRKGLDSILVNQFKINKGILAFTNNQVYFDHALLNNAKVDFQKVKATCIAYIKQQDGIADAVDLQTVSTATLPDEIKKRITNGYNASRSGDIYFIERSNWFGSSGTDTTHGSWYNYDAHIPLLFMGWNVKPGKTNEVYYMTDIAATVAVMLRIQMPSGSLGRPITQITE
jgi:predicted AlkP superfamily pyrophosphatase or phosphodiesterase